MEYKPVKCPDCGVWWRTPEHKCENPKQPSSPNGPAGPSDINPYSRFIPKGKDYYPPHKEPGCPQCGVKGPHYCVGSRDHEHPDRQIKPRLFDWKKDKDGEKDD